jgi:hypothetical protein
MAVLILIGWTKQSLAKHNTMQPSYLHYFFSSVAHVWVPGAKTTGPIVKKFGFS